jgi:hypothetical protein
VGDARIDQLQYSFLALTNVEHDLDRLVLNVDYFEAIAIQLQLTDLNAVIKQICVFLDYVIRHIYFVALKHDVLIFQRLHIQYHVERVFDLLVFRKHCSLF